MAELKTRKNDASVADFIAGIADEGQRKDSKKIAALMRRVTGKAPKMWGTNIVGFGDHAYEGAGGKERRWFLAGFSPRKQNLTLYIMSGFGGQNALMKKLGKHSTGKACLYIKRLDDVDEQVLEQLVRASVAALQAGD